MTGSKTIQKATFNFSGPRLSPMLNHMNATVEQIERPLMTPDEVMRLRPPLKEGQGNNERIVAPGDMLIFVAGHYPIYGKQMLYFVDPELAKRAGEPPPSTFFAIEGGRLVRQRAADRTANVISRAELLPAGPEGVNGTDTSHMDLSGGAEIPVTADLEHELPPSGGFIEELEIDRQRPFARLKRQRIGAIECHAEEHH
jgi:type IV secretion system protein VirD4